MPTKPYPSEAAVKCPAIPKLVDDSQDSQSRWVGGMVDLYKNCALRHNTLVDWVKE